MIKSSPWFRPETAPRCSAGDEARWPGSAWVLGWAAWLALGISSFPVAAGEAAKERMTAVYDRASGRAMLAEAGQPVLAYIYETNPPPPGYFESLTEKQTPSARKYGIPRSDYIHPLYALDGTALTSDWNRDHAHHRGIYWAWPEVGFNGEKGDLHALQRVWARPTGKIEVQHGPNWAEVMAENRWLWEDKTPIVLETTRIRAWRTDAGVRHVDLALRFEALAPTVTLARRGTSHYGGLNIRLAPIADMKLVHHADPDGQTPRVAWQGALGRWPNATGPASVYVFEASANPGYPGDYVEYPDLPWFQPTFPRANTRFALEPGQPLTLRYRFSIRSGKPPSVEDLRQEWQSYQRLLQP